MIKINRTPSRSELRQFAGIWFPGFFLVVGAFAAHRWGWSTPIMAVWSVVATVSVLGVLLPSAVRPLYLAWMYAAYPVGWLISHLVLTMLYFGVFTPVGITFRLLGKDLLERSFERSAKTYWTARRPTENASQYFRQF